MPSLETGGNPAFSKASLSAVLTFNGTGQAASTDVTLWTPYTIPASSLAVGTTFQVILGMDCDLINSATARNLVFSIKLGGTMVGQTTVALKASVAATNKAALLSGLLVCHATGASGTMRFDGFVWDSIGSTASDNTSSMQSVVAGVTIDTTASQAVTLTVNESVNSVADLVRAESGSFVLTTP